MSYYSLHNIFIVLTSLITFLFPFLIVFIAIFAKKRAQSKGAARRPAHPNRRVHRHYNQGRPYDPTTNTADYPSACQASYDPVRARDQLETLLKAGHLTQEEYRQRLEDLKNYRHC